MIRINSSVSFSSLSTTLYIGEKSITSTFCLPSVLKHSFASNSRTELNPIFISKLLGYIISLFYFVFAFAAKVQHILEKNLFFACRFEKHSYLCNALREKHSTKGVSER